MPSITNENGTFTISNHGLYHALIFFGPPDFIERCRNFSQNYSLIKNIDKSFRLINSVRENERWYILAPEEKILNAFKNCIAAEMFLNGVARKGISINEDEENCEIVVDRDENEFEQLVVEETGKFFQEKLKFEDYPFHFDREPDFYPHSKSDKEEKKEKSTEDMDGGDFQEIIDQYAENGGLRDDKGRFRYA